MRLLAGGISKRDTNRTGGISETAILMRFLQLGYVVLTPYGGNQRYDLMIEDVEGQFWRIQCKTARINENGTALTFSTSIRNVTGKNRQPRYYWGQCDYFAAYCEKLNKIYLVPVDQIDTQSVTLRLMPLPPNKPQQNVLWASDYEL